MAAEDKKTGSSLFDWLPGAKDIEALEGIERDLRNRKRKGNRLTLLLAGLGVGYQLLLQFQGKDLDGLGRLFVGVLPAGARSVLGQHAGAVGLALLVASALVFVGVRFSSLLLALSREPFRYSYSVGAFAALPNERVTLEGKDRLALLPLDLTERIDNRIDRLSLLRAAPLAGSSSGGSQSHIAISGDLVLREDPDGQWELFAMPRVRIGDVTAPETLSFTVRFPLPGALGAKGELAFSAEQYRQFCERVYASVALAIYERIDADLEEKVTQFPTTFRRAVARLNEADDFAQSNTIDANERAEEQYRKALQSFNRTWSLALARWACALGLPLALYLRVFELHAAILAGMARCSVTRSVTAALAGRLKRPSYAVHAPLELLVGTLRPLHTSYAQRNQSSFAQRLVAAPLPRLEIRRQVRRRRQERLARALFDGLVALAMANDHADKPRRARERLDEALAIDPALAVLNRGYLWVDAKLRLDLDGRIERLRRLMEVAPGFQIGQFQLAVALEMRMRALDQITPESARAVISEYERVLAINPGNVAALASLGYLHWLLGELDPAQQRFQEGLALNEIVRETFVGELNYGLARVWAEQPSAADATSAAKLVYRALACFEIAVATSPGLATADEQVERSAAAGAWDFMGEALYRRFLIYRQRVSGRLRSLRHSSDARLIPAQPALSRLRCFVFNDAGNAAMQLHVRLRNPSARIRAGRLFCLSLQAWNHCAAAHVNLARHAGWAQCPIPLDNLDAAIRLAPDWPRPRADRLVALYDQYRGKRNRRGADMDARKKDLKHARAERGSLQPPRAAIQPALLQNADARSDYNTTQLINDRETAQARIRRLELELKEAQRELDMLDREWKNEVSEDLSMLLQRFPLGRVIDKGGALPTDQQPYPVSAHLKNPKVDVELLTSTEQELLGSALRALTYLIDQKPEIADDILRCCTELRSRLSDESWIWVSLHCDVLKRRAEKPPLNDTDLNALKLARQQRLRIAKGWMDGDPVDNNALEWLISLETNPSPKGEVERAGFGLGFQLLVSAATGPMATAAARRGMTRVLLEFSALQMVDDRSPPKEKGAGDHETRPARAFWRELATVARRLGRPGEPALRADWAVWYDAATPVLLDAPPSQLRCLRLTAVAAGRAITPAVRARWWCRCARVAARALADASEQHTDAKVDFARWYAQATARAGAIRSGSAEPFLQDVLGDTARQLRAEFFESDPPRDVGLPLVRVLLGNDLIPLVATPDGELTAAVHDAIRTQRTEMLQRFGIEMPALQFSGPGPGQPPNRWDLLLHSNPVAFGEIEPWAQTTTPHGTDPLSQMMSRITGEFHAMLPVLVGLQEMDRLLDSIESSLAMALRAKLRGLPRLLALAHALLALELPLDVAALAKLVVDEPSFDFDRLILRARATERARAALIARADQTVMWSVPINLQTRLMAFVDGDGDGRALALWPGDLNALQAVLRGLAPSPDELSIVIDEPLLLSGLTAVLRRSRRRALVLVRDELALHQQFARKSEIDYLPLIGDPLAARLLA